VYNIEQTEKGNSRFNPDFLKIILRLKNHRYANQVDGTNTQYNDHLKVASP
jgi:hypothetical protein